MLPSHSVELKQGKIVKGIFKSIHLASKCCAGAKKKASREDISYLACVRQLRNSKDFVAKACANGTTGGSGGFKPCEVAEALD